MSDHNQTDEAAENPESIEELASQHPIPTEIVDEVMEDEATLFGNSDRRRMHTVLAAIDDMLTDRVPPVTRDSARVGGEFREVDVLAGTVLGTRIQVVSDYGRDTYRLPRDTDTAALPVRRVHLRFARTMTDDPDGGVVVSIDD